MITTKPRIGLVFSMLSWLWMVGLLGLVVRARFFLGYWPSPSHPDPKLLPFELHHIILSFGFYLLGWLLPLAFGVYMLNALFFKRKFRQQPLLVFTIGWALIAVMFFTPHTSANWIAWFLD